ncbi:MAG: biotin/lipoyl-containing protein, partial [SAR324 cluster bacterium]|nr:biotin/lipoyl-containing protein [SAR324 cluster bacterium]
MTQIKQVQVPDMGDFQDVEIIEVHIQAGDRIESENPLITLESDKATMDVPAPFSGKVENVLIKVGDKVSEGTPIVDLQTSDDAKAKQISTTDKKRDTQNLEILQDSGNLSSSPESPENQTDSGESTKANSFSSEPELMLMPDMGDFTEVDIIEVLVKTGDQVKPEDSVITLESDKATMDVPAPLKGTIQEMFVKTGQKISKGQKIALILPDSETPNQAIQNTDTNMESSVTETSKKPSTEERTSTGRRPPVSEPIDHQQFLKAHASPSVRKFARELGVDLSRVNGSGRKGRITHEDVQGHVKERLSAPSTAQSLTGTVPQIPEIDFSQFGEIEINPLSRIRKKGAEHLHRAWLNLPMVTNHDEADITELEAFRQKLKKEAAEQNIRLTMLAFLLKATAANLKKHPDFCSSLSPDGQNLIHKRYCHIGVAVDTEEGLV